MRVLAASLLVVGAFAGCFGGDDAPASGDAAAPPPFPGLDLAHFRHLMNGTAEPLDPLGVIELARVPLPAGEPTAARLLFDGEAFALALDEEGGPARHLFVRVVDDVSNATASGWRGCTADAAAMVTALVPDAPLDANATYAFEVHAFAAGGTACAATCPEHPCDGGHVRVPLDLSPRVTVTMEGPDAGADALDQLETSASGSPAPRGEGNYTVTVEASRFVRAMVRFDFAASRIASASPDAVARNYSTAFVPLDGTRRLGDAANASADGGTVRATYTFRIDYENGTAHGPTGGSEEQSFRAEVVATNPVGAGGRSTRAEAVLAVTVDYEVP